MNTIREVGVPPHSILAEQALLGGLMLENQSWDRVADKVAPEDFYHREHRLIFDAIRKLAEEEQPFDVVTLAETLERNGSLGDAGGLPYIGTLVQDAASSVNVGAYAKTVRDDSIKREFLKAADDLAENARSSTASELIEQLDQRLDKLRDRADTSEVRLRKREDLMLTPRELKGAKLTTTCIVKDYLYADVAQLVAPGGTGKTTMVLYEASCIALRRSLWGLEVVTPGWTLIITKEDRREQLAARLLRIMRAMGLDEHEKEAVLRHVIIWDIVGTNLKLTELSKGRICQTGLARRIVRQYRDDPPLMVVFDPLVSFGASEALVNENEQALVEVARHIVRHLGCCVRFIHHTGKANARVGATDQYSGRGGSALADGTRMTAVLADWDGRQSLPSGCTPDPKSAMFKLERPKVSYAQPNRPTIWIKRTGFRFEHFCAAHKTPEQRLEEQTAQILRFLEDQLRQGRYHTQHSLEQQSDVIGISRKDLRAALSTLLDGGSVVKAPVPPTHRQGARTTFLCPASMADQFSGQAA